MIYKVTQHGKLTKWIATLQESHNSNIHESKIKECVINKFIMRDTLKCWEGIGIFDRGGFKFNPVSFLISTRSKS